MIKNTPSEIKTLDSYIHMIMKSACDGSNKIWLEYAEKRKYHIIKLKPSIEDIFDCTITNDQKKNIISDGYNCTKLFFETRKTV